MGLKLRVKEGVWERAVEKDHPSSSMEPMAACTNTLMPPLIADPAKSHCCLSNVFVIAFSALTEIENVDQETMHKV